MNRPGRAGPRPAAGVSSDAPSPCRAGFALVVVLGFLAVLVTLGMLFAVVSSIERTTSRNALDAARSRLAAQAGVEAALAHLRAVARHGEDVNANGRLDPGEDANGNGRLDDFLSDGRWIWRDAARPSFAAPDADGKPLRFRIDGVERGISGALDVSTYAPGGNVYTLRIRDANAHLHLNDGLDRPADTERLRRVLNRLGGRPAVGIRQLGDRLLGARPPEGFRSLHQIRPVLSAAEMERVAPYLTVHAWVDGSVANPVPVSAYEVLRAGSPYPVRTLRPVNADAPATRIYRYGRGVNVAGMPNDTRVGFHQASRPVGPADTHAAVYALDELHPQWIEITSRAPVNVNLASRELLAALIEGIQGFFVLGHSFSPFAADRLYAGPVTDPSNPHGNWFRLQLTWDGSQGATAGGEFGHLYLTEPFTAQEADDLADRIVAERARRPFRSWPQFEDFLDGLVWHPRHNPGGPIRDCRDGFWTEPNGHGAPAILSADARRQAASRARADALKANFNPNLHLNELNPDRALARLVDKTDLLEASTELCFQPMGIFHVESVGSVLAPDGETAGGFQTIAESRLVAALRVWDAVRLTSMKDFWGTDGKNRKQDDPPPRPADFLPADARDQGRSVTYNTSNNRAIEIGPEPDNGLSDNDLDSLEYDGYVALSTIGGTLPHSAYREGRTKDKWRTWRTRRSNYHPAGDLLHAHFDFDGDAHYTCWSAFAPARDHLRHNFARRHDEGSWEWNFFNYADQPVICQDGNSASVRLAWPTRGPYCAAYAEPPDYDVNPETTAREIVHRCGRSFRGPADPPPVRRAYPPQDLRIDGLYIERHSCVAYTAGPHGENFDPQRGAIAYWIKPAFAPEHTASVKKFFSVARFHGTGEAPEPEQDLAVRHFNPTPFGHFFLPAPSADESAAPLYAQANGSWPSRAFGFGFGFSNRGPTGTPWNVYRAADGAGPGGLRVGVEGGVVTPCLNHVGHRDEADGRRDPAGERAQNLLASHRWIHVLAAWDMTAATPELAWRMWVNGRERPASHGALYRLAKPETGFAFPIDPFSGDPPDRRRTWVYDDFDNPNPIRIGEPSRLEHAPCPLPHSERVRCPLGHDNCTMLLHYAMNFVPDSTVDEFYVWGDPVLGVAEGHDQAWSVGRYYRGGDGWYLTPAFLLAAERRRGSLPPVGTAAPPEDPSGISPFVPPSIQDDGQGGVLSPLRPRLLALSWTAWAGAYRRDEDRLVLFDYQRDPPTPLRAWIEAAVSVDGGKTWRGRKRQAAEDPRSLPAGVLWADGGWSPIVGEDGEVIEAADPDQVRVALHFASEIDPLNSILLETLLLDDLTLFYEPSGLEVLECTWE